MSTDKETSQVFRIVDANLNRLGEGLRVLEDIARMMLNATDLTQQLKTMRHNLTRADLCVNQKLIQSRNSEDDVGINLDVAGEFKNKDLPAVLIANARRTQESLRVLEETAKLPIVPFDSEKYKQARFDLYTIERNLLSRLLRKDKVQRLSGLYVIIDTQSLNGRDHLEVASQTIRGGARTIQLRDKSTPKKELLIIARKLKELCISNNVLFIINDYLDLTLAANADGLHIGQEDLPVAEARKALPIDKIIGCSATTVAQATTAEAEGADYVGLGAIFPTISKENIEVSGLSVLKQVTKNVKIPVVAIGGINRSNIKEVMAAGADSAAVISAVLQASDPEAITRELVGLMEK